MRQATSITHREHKGKLDLLASQLTQQGFGVITEPTKEQLPFDLGNYCPDLVAAKHNAGVIVELKASTSRLSIDRFQEIAQEIARHSGWKFLLITPEDVNTDKILASVGGSSSWEQLQAKLNQATTILEQGALEASILYLWSIFESALRKRAIEQNTPIERFPTSKLLNHMYSLGELSVEHIDTLQSVMGIRNQIAHGINTPLEPEIVWQFLKIVAGLLDEWSVTEGMNADGSVV
jgi:hypothetical protein